MRTVRFLIAAVALVALSTGNADAQGFLDRLGKAAGRAAERAVTRQAEKRAEDAVNKTIDGALDGKSEEEQQNQQQAGDPAVDAQGNPQAPAGQQTPQSAQMAWNKFDFVSGDEIMFEDNLVGEQLGEFPSMWDLKSGDAEVASINGENAISLTPGTLILPFFEKKDYLPEVFTIEFDMYLPMGTMNQIGMNSRWMIRLRDAADKQIFLMDISNNRDNKNVPYPVRWNWLSGGGSNQGETEYLWKYNDFNRISISFNQRALKVYLNETRVVNIPRCDAPTKFEVYAYQGGRELRLIKNVRIAKGAVPLYDRMMSEGKFITYGITFDVGKSTIKPESMGEINRIVTLMTENPDLRFSVEGHTDSTGNAAGNQTLSEARSKAIVDKLVSLGIAADRLTSSGKGQNNPIADNATDEGRAKNRRVEFVKM